MPGPLGYPDWQRQTDYDGPILYHVAADAANTRTTNVFPVSKFAYIAAHDIVVTNNTSVNYTWFSDNAGTIQVGTRTFTLTTLLGLAQYRLVNLGPYVQIVWTSLVAGGMGHSADIFPTNRYHPLEFVPTGSRLIDQQNVAIAANATATLYSADYYAGPARIWAFSAQSMNVQVQSLNTVNVWDIVDSNTSTANVNLLYDTVVPAGAWRVQITNQTASATTYYLVIVPSMSGST